MLGASWPFCGSSSIPRIHRRPSSRIGLFIWPIGGRKWPKFWQRGSVISIPARETSGLVWGFPSLCTSAPEFPSCRYGTGRVIAGRILSLPSRRMARRWVCGRGRAPIAPRVKMPCASAPRGPRSRRFNDNAAVSLLLGSRSPSEAMVDDIYGSWPVVVCLPCRWVAPEMGSNHHLPCENRGPFILGRRAVISCDGGHRLLGVLVIEHRRRCRTRLAAAFIVASASHLRIAVSPRLFMPALCPLVAA